MFERDGQQFGSILVGGEGSYRNLPVKDAEEAPAKKAASKKAESAPEEEPAPEPEETDEGTEESDVPHVSDKKEVWVDFAVSQGLDREEAESFTKQDLIDEYGG